MLHSLGNQDETRDFLINPKVFGMLTRLQELIHSKRKPKFETNTNSKYSEILSEFALQFGGDPGGRRKPEARPENPLEKLGNEFKPSKRHHNYLHWYDFHLNHLRQDAKKVLEIGVETPRSMKMWEEYFPNATIFGMDIDETCKRVEGGRKKIFIGDQTNPDDLNRFLCEHGTNFDVIIDDGLHSEDSILTSFACLFPALKPGGVFIVEDIIKQPKVVQFFSDLAQNVNFWPQNHPGSKWISVSHFEESDWLTRNVVGVSIHRYLAFVVRGENPEINPYLMTATEFETKKQELRDDVNRVIDNCLQEGIEPRPDIVSQKLGDRGLTTIREELKKRDLL